MPLYRLLQNCAFEPEIIQAMSIAFESACHRLGLAATDDPVRDQVARKVIEFAEQGEREADRLLARTLEHFQAS